jgi:hypothetical protein
VSRLAEDIQQFARTAGQVDPAGVGGTDVFDRHAIQRLASCKAKGSAGQHDVLDVIRQRSQRADEVLTGEQA